MGCCTASSGRSTVLRRGSTIRRQRSDDPKSAPDHSRSVANRSLSDRKRSCRGSFVSHPELDRPYSALANPTEPRRSHAGADRPERVPSRPSCYRRRGRQLYAATSSSTARCGSSSDPRLRAATRVEARRSESGARRPLAPARPTRRRHWTVDVLFHLSAAPRTTRAASVWVHASPNRGHRPVSIGQASSTLAIGAHDHSTDWASSLVHVASRVSQLVRCRTER